MLFRRFDRARAGDSGFAEKIPEMRRSLTIMLAVVGPRLLTSNAWTGIDEGGISSYTKDGEHKRTTRAGRLIP